MASLFTRSLTGGIGSKWLPGEPQQGFSPRALMSWATPRPDGHLTRRTLRFAYYSVPRVRVFEGKDCLQSMAVTWRNMHEQAGP